MVVDRVHPRDPQLRAKSLGALKKQDTTALQFAAHAADTLASSYLKKFAPSFNHYAALAQAAVTVICFAFAPPQAGLYALGAALIALSFRDAFTHQEEALPETQYFLDSAADAATAGLFVIASQGLAVVALRSLVLPVQVLYRGLLVAMPLIATLRMVLRPKPAPARTGEPEQEKISAQKLYRKTRWLNFLWLVTVDGLVVQNVTDKHGYFPDFLRGFLPLFCFGTWKLSQVDDLCCRDNLLTLFTSLKAKTLRRMRGNVAAGPDAPTNANYSTFKLFQLGFFGVMVLSLLPAVEPFLFGEPLMQSIWKATGSVLAFTVALAAWPRVKAANRAAARALLAEARKEEEKAKGA
ncbi:MAG TPA: hypothetical protein VGK48_19055 [Terriglobia bacterium]